MHFIHILDTLKLQKAIALLFFSSDINQAQSSSIPATFPDYWGHTSAQFSLNCEHGLWLCVPKQISISGSLLLALSHIFVDMQTSGFVDCQVMDCGCLMLEVTSFQYFRFNTQIQSCRGCQQVLSQAPGQGWNSELRLEDRVLLINIKLKYM